MRALSASSLKLHLISLCWLYEIICASTTAGCVCVRGDPPWETRLAQFSRYIYITYIVLCYTAFDISKDHCNMFYSFITSIHVWICLCLNESLPITVGSCIYSSRMHLADCKFAVVPPGHPLCVKDRIIAFDSRQLLFKQFRAMMFTAWLTRCNGLCELLPWRTSEQKTME